MISWRSLFLAQELIMVIFLRNNLVRIEYSAYFLSRTSKNKRTLSYVVLSTIGSISKIGMVKTGSKNHNTWRQS